MGYDALMRASQAQGKAASLHTGPTGEVVAINNWRSRTSQIVPRMLQMHPAIVITAGGMLYLTLALCFAALYFAAGADCFDFEIAEYAAFVPLTSAHLALCSW